MLHRRTVLKSLAGLGLTAVYPPLLPLVHAAGTPGPAMSHTGIPVIMFHKTMNVPRHPEDISPAQLTTVLDTVFRAGFYPVNISDIVSGTVDQRIPSGGIPLGITVDDSHESTIFKSRHTSTPFLDVFTTTCAHHGRTPRGTFFLSEHSDNRQPGRAGYFGANGRLREAMDHLSAFSGLESGLHTRRHELVRGLEYEAMEAVLQEQHDQLLAASVLHRTVPLFSYPYGVPCAPSGIRALTERGFQAAVIAAPGIDEGPTGMAPLCPYDGKLQCDPWRIPRINIGSGGYGTDFGEIQLDPLDDLHKDVLKRAHLYQVS